MKSIIVNEKRYFSFKQDEATGKYYLAIPISKSFVDYMEYYEVEKEMIDNYPSNLQEVERFVYKCRVGEMFHLSLDKMEKGDIAKRGQPWDPGNTAPE